MYFYYFFQKRYRNACQQAECITGFLLFILPILSFTVVIRSSSSIFFHGLLFFTGWCTWTFVEYILHRFWMHDKDSNSAMAQTHHHHHTHPTEIVVTNLHRLALISVFVMLVLVGAYLNDYFTFLVGLFFGVTGYFLMHRFLHLKLAQQVFKRLVRYHIYHHCKYPNTCFGISVPWWDDLFKTVPSTPRITQRIIDFYFNGHEESHHSLSKHATVIEKTMDRLNSCDNNCKTCKADFKNGNSY